METPQEVETACIERVRLWNDKRDEDGPFDIIGDVHGCADELEELLTELGYVKSELVSSERAWIDLCYAHPDGRRAIFVGDLVDRGPRIVDSLSIVRNMVQSGTGICVPGNHDVRLLRKLRGRKVRITHGLTESLADIDSISAGDQDEFRSQLIEFIDGLISHYVFDEGRLVVAHAGMKEEMQGRGSSKVRQVCPVWGNDG